ncbi:unnamed protein product [Allacma fusca]|uniref:Protein SMG9 n=1 Tax=Allacma fusca TaxID=39272 RepID=A0A8J2KIG1_9HEXA|nr:unnamed protein product [Allacma fusca]
MFITLRFNNYAGRDRNRDSDRDWNRDRDRNRDRQRDRGQRRDRDSERSQGGGITGTSHDTAPVHGPVVLLKRPDAAGAAVSGPTVSSKDSREGRTERDQQPSQGKPTAILLRAGQWNKGDSIPDLRGTGSALTGSGVPSEPSSGEVKLVKSKPTAQSSTLKPLYTFPHQHAIALLNANKDMTMETDLEFITANSNSTDFFVITAVGVPQTGKSTLLSYLGTPSEFGESKLFEPRKLHQQKECSVYMTSSKIILIEMASIFNGAAASDMINLMGPQGTLETAAMSWNLRIVSWALSVSHVVLLVSEQLVDPNLLQLINSASIIHPTEPMFGDGASAELVYVCNKASHSLLEVNNSSAVRSAESVFNSSLGRSPRISQNFFTLPHLRWKDQRIGFKNFKFRVEDFVRYNRATFSSELKNVKRFPQSVTLGEWQQAATRVWDDFNQNSGFQSYMKLLP